MRVFAHSDDKGSRLSRMGSTERLAEAARDVLVTSGVPAARVVPLGRGSDEPVAPNSSAKNRAKNRRLELVVERPEAPATTTSAAPTTPLAASTLSPPLAALKVNGVSTPMSG